MNNRIDLKIPRRPVAVDARLFAGSSTGDSTYWTAMLESLAKLAPDAPIHLFSDRPIPGAPFPVKVVASRWSRLWSLVSFPLAARKYGAVHVQYALSPLVRRGISTIHDVSFFVGPEWFQPKDLVLLKAGARAAAKRALRIITVSEPSLREIESYLPSSKGKTIAIENACPPWIQAGADPGPVLEKYGLEGPYLLTVGTRWPRKNMELAVQAVDMLALELPHQLVVTGKAGWGDQELGRRGKATGYVSREELSALYAGADLYLAPSRHEGFGIPVLEAMRCGCPVLASPIEAFRAAGGDAAAYAPSFEPGDWADWMSESLPDSGKMRSMRERGRTWEPRFSWRESARRHLDVYAEVAG
ncbi:glycosyltransferase family 1 protein [bacterium]|nr:MAG: glycosyltransferase family 1 protein [bacterium]